MRSSAGSLSFPARPLQESHIDSRWYTACLRYGWKFLNELSMGPTGGTYIVGTYCLILVRGALGAGSTWAAFRIAPSVKLRATCAWFVALLSLCVSFFSTSTSP